MVANRIQGKIILVSSMLGLLSFVGWSAYAPAKYAIRGKLNKVPTRDLMLITKRPLLFAFCVGLAETLRNELKLYNISVHCYFPGTILTPGFEEEQKDKPALTAKIEGGGGTDQTPEQCADLLIKSESIHL